MNVAFYIAGGVAVASTMLTVIGKNAVHSLLYLIVSLLAVSVVFFVLGAPFIAALEAIVYAGAIMVLFIFVIMMLNRGKASVDQEGAWLAPGIWRGPAVLTLILAGEMFWVIFGMESAPSATRIVAPKELSLSLFGPYVLVVELASILLLAGLVGAYHLGRRTAARKEIKTS